MPIFREVGDKVNVSLDKTIVSINNRVVSSFMYFTISKNAYDEIRDMIHPRLKSSLGPILVHQILCHPHLLNPLLSFFRLCFLFVIILAHD